MAKQHQTRFVHIDSDPNATLPYAVFHPDQPMLAQGALWFSRSQAKRLHDDLARVLGLGEPLGPCAECGSENAVCLDCETQLR